MGLFDIFGRRPPKSGDPALMEVASLMRRNLEALGLHVRATPHGTGFCEIVASTSARLLTLPGGKEASGVALLLAPAYAPPTLVVEQINSLTPGLGRKMVGAALDGLRTRPGLIRRVRVNDLSPFQPDGRRWWAHVAEAHPDFDWLITHDPDDATHWPALVEPDSPAFRARQEKLAALCATLGGDPRRVTLSPARKTFDYLGQRFTSEGETLPGGDIVIYYDPQMSDARLGCCLAHELQHQRYFAVRAAYAAEPAQGPLHRDFAGFTPELLAAARGVSAYSNEHWDAWRAPHPPRLFSDELAEGGSEPINETIAEVAKAFYNWGDDVRIHPLWKSLKLAVDAAYAGLSR